MAIKIICVGKIKRPFIADACAYYQKLLSRFHKCEIIELPECASGDNIHIRRREGERALSAAKACDYVVALDISGVKMDSRAFAKTLTEAALRAPAIGFLIGGSLGLSEDVLTAADLRLSFSDMTFPHQLFRVLLLEQIYRAFTIEANHPYHK